MILLTHNSSVFGILDVSAIVIQLAFLIIAKQWSGFIKDCNKFDYKIRSYGIPNRLKLKLKFTFISLLLSTTSTFEKFIV